MINIALKQAIAMATLAVGVSVGANAAEPPVDTLTDVGLVKRGSVGTFTGVVPGGSVSFNDIVTFTLEQRNVASYYDVVNLPTSGFHSFHTVLSGISLFTYGADRIRGTTDDKLLGSDVPLRGTPAGQRIDFVYNGSVTGPAYISITGVTEGAGGVYAGAITYAPIPEPETFALMLAGLGLLGAVVRRRDKTLQAKTS